MTIFARQQGFVLFTTIVILSSITLVVLAHMQIIHIFAKYLSQVRKQEEIFQHLERAANQLLSKPVRARCIILAQDPNFLIKKLFKHEVCSYADEKYSYSYFFEDLGEFPCLKTKIAGIVYSTAHRRLSIRILQNPGILQIRLVMKIKDKTCELFKPRFINLGVSSWRYLV